MFWISNWLNAIPCYPCCFEYGYVEALLQLCGIWCLGASAECIILLPCLRVGDGGSVLGCCCGICAGLDSVIYAAIKGGVALGFAGGGQHVEAKQDRVVVRALHILENLMLSDVLKAATGYQEMV